MASLLMLLMYAFVGPFAILKLYAKNLMRRAYENHILLKLTASMISLAVASQIAYDYRTKNTFIWLTSALVTCLLNYWYIIPVLLIYALPIVKKVIKSWLLLVDLFSERILRPSSTKFRQLLPAIWTLESGDKLWPVESIRFMLTYGSIGPALYLGYQSYLYLVFGISFNLCIAIGVTILVITTIWHLLEAIDRDLYPFIFAIIVQYYIIPIRSALNIPLTLLLTTFLFPFLNNLLTSNSIRELIQNMKLMNFRTFLEANANYKQFFSEFVHLFLTIYLTYSVLLVCLTSDVPWYLTLSIFVFFPIYLYTNLIRLILIEPNTIMFLFTSFLLSKLILNRRMEDHFIYKYFLLTMILTFYFALIYPLFYHLLRRLVIKSASRIGSELRFFRERIHRITSKFSERYLRVTYIHDPSKDFILHLCNAIISGCLLTIVPINIVFRMIFSLLSYLLLGRLLLTRGLEILAIFMSLCTSIAAGAHVYDRYEKSILFTMAIALITYVSTLVIAFPMIYRCVQLVLTSLPWIESFNAYLKKLFAFAWSYFDIFWPHILANFNEVKMQIEQSRINIFQHSRTVQ